MWQRKYMSQKELENVMDEDDDTISHNMALDSECEGDSDADDDLPDTIIRNFIPKSLRKQSEDLPSTSVQENDSSQVSQQNLSLPSTSNLNKCPFQNIGNSSDARDESCFEDSDDSIADPDYQVEQISKRRKLCVAELEKINNNFDYGSDSDSDTEEVIEEEINSARKKKPLEKSYKWTKSTKIPDMYREARFTEKVGANIIIDINSPLSTLLQFLPDAFLVKIVEESNLYAQQLRKNDDFIKITLIELKAFLGILVFMGIHPLPSIKLYWSEDENFHVERIARIMTLKRFLFILRHLHLNDNSKMPQRDTDQYDKLYKLRPLINHLKTTFSITYSPNRNISIDESMIGYKGRSSMKQYMPMKPTKRGFKVWACCCSEIGYLLNFDIYTGKNDDGTVALSLGERVVTRLSTSYVGKKYCLYFDNCFSSIALLDNLLEKKSFACGTLRTDRKYYPKDMFKNEKELQKSEFDFAQSENIGIVKWKDRGTKWVSVASTIHDPGETTSVIRKKVQGEKLPVNCPKMISSYNKYMEGVDFFDQYMAFYDMNHKSRRWWIKIFFYLIEACVALETA